MSRTCDLCGNSLPRGKRKYHTDCRSKALAERRYTVSVPIEMRESFRRHIGRARKQKERSSNVLGCSAKELAEARAAKAIMKKSRWEQELVGKLKLLGAPEPILEYGFHEDRKWRFDLAWPDRKIAAEVEGGIWIRGRHNRGGGFEEDCRKYNSARALGWQVYRFTASMIESGEATGLLMAVLGWE